HPGGVRLAAFARTHATQCCMGEAAAVLAISKFGGDLARRVVGAELEMRVDRVGIDDLTGIHLPLRIPDALELAHGLNEFGPVLFHQKLRALLTVAMLA